MQARVEQIQATFQKHHQAFLTQHPPLNTPPPPSSPSAKVLKGKSGGVGLKKGIDCSKSGKKYVI